MHTKLRLAVQNDTERIWQILKQAIERRRLEGSNQWQDGYPNQESVNNDIEKKAAYVLTKENAVIGYCAILINDEPAYNAIEGQWLTHGDFVVYHRVAIAEEELGKGYALEMMQHIEQFAQEKNIKSIKADTNFDNRPMLTLFHKLGYQYCGEVYFRGSARKAFEKVVK